MTSLLPLIPICLYMVVGIVSAVMAFKSLTWRTFLPFHERAAGLPWDSLGAGGQAVVLALMRVSGLGFLVVALLLVVFPVVTYGDQGLFMRFAVPSVALLYCVGLLVINFRLSAKTGVTTPWKGALYAALLLLVGMTMAAIQS